MPTHIERRKPSACGCTKHRAAVGTFLSGRDEFQIEGCTSLISSASMVDTVSTGKHHQDEDSNDKHIPGALRKVLHQTNLGMKVQVGCRNLLLLHGIQQRFYRWKVVGCSCAPPPDKTLDGFVACIIEIRELVASLSHMTFPL